MAKTTVSIPDGLLDEIDKRAEAAGTTRSGFVQEAATHYITALDQEQARLEREERIGKAIEGMRELSKLMPPGTDGTEIIRKFRDMPEPWLSQSDSTGE